MIGDWQPDEPPVPPDVLTARRRAWPRRNHDSNSSQDRVSGHRSVPARPNRNTPFPFGYTFTDEDATIGKVTFKAVAVLPYEVRDALPADNTVIAIATNVKWPKAL